MKILLILIFALVFVSSAYAVCDPNKDVGGYTCTTDSSNKECGGIRIEGKCYDCGNPNDKICPENFGMTCGTSDPDCGAAGACTVCTDCDTFLGFGCNQEECAKCGSCYYLGIGSGCEACNTLTCDNIKVADCGTKCPDLNCEVKDGTCVEKTIQIGGAIIGIGGNIKIGTVTLTITDGVLSGDVTDGDLTDGTITVTLEDGSEITVDITDGTVEDGIITITEGEVSITAGDGTELTGDIISGELIFSVDEDGNIVYEDSSFVIEDTYGDMWEVSIVDGEITFEPYIEEDLGTTEPCADTPDFPKACINPDDPEQYQCVGEDESCEGLDFSSDNTCTINNCDTETAPEGCVCSAFTEEGMVLGYEEPTEFPIFTWFNLIITCAILIGFYTFRNLRKR